MEAIEALEKENPNGKMSAEEVVELFHQEGPQQLLLMEYLEKRIYDLVNKIHIFKGVIVVGVS